MKYYNIIRFYQSGKRSTVKRQVTREEAQAHCNDPETSSRTCQKPENTQRTGKHGPWFDGYEEAR